jgi:hypothetical protein
VVLVFTPMAVRAQMPPRFGTESPYQPGMQQGGPSLAEQNWARQQWEQRQQTQQQAQELERQRQWIEVLSRGV